MEDRSEPQRGGKDHVCFARIGFYGGAGCVSVHFRTRRQLDELIRLLTDLRDDPEAQRDHVHLQDVSYRRVQPWTRDGDEGSPASLGVEIVFTSPRHRCDGTHAALLSKGARLLRRAR